MPLWPDRGLWRHRDFINLWAAQIVSAFGNRITRTALPALAIVTLGASDAEVALLAALGVAPAIVVSLAASGFIDRIAKKPLLIAMDLARFVLVASVPIVAWVGGLGMLQLYGVAVLACVAGTLFQIADQAFLPVVVEKEHLVEGNSKLGATDSIAEIAGPGIAGALIALVTAPVAVLLDAFSFLWSALFVARIQVVETPSTREPGRPLARAAAGIRAIWASRHVRPLFIAEMLGMLSWGFFAALYMLFALRELGMDIAVVGVIIGFGGIGAFAGALFGTWVTRALGFGAALLVFLVLNMGAGAFVALARGPGWDSIALLVAHQLIGDCFAVAYAIQARSLRQSAMPRKVLGRVAAAQVTMQASMLTLGALAAVPLAEWLGVRGAVWTGVLVGMASIVVVLASPVARLRTIGDAVPAPLPDGTDGA